jgi:DNA-binding NarL/FixJ family response regulator
VTCVVEVCIVDDVYTCVALHLGDAAELLGDRRLARSYYMQAAGKISFRPELALTHLLAELLADDPKDAELSDAVEHLDLALPELREMKMRPALERAQALSHKLEPARGPERHRTSAPDSLTAREREIASLMADGQNNHQIAERLVIAEGTVEEHVNHVLVKLGLRSRTQVATWFVGQRAE